MNLRPKFRARPNWKPSSRPQFLRKGKPPVNPCGISLRKKKLVCLPRNTRTQAAAGLQRSGRRFNSKRSTPRVIHSERSGSKHERVRLTGPARVKRRAEIFERAGGRCEEMVRVYHPDFLVAVGSFRCPNRATEWSHAKHAANKCDCYSPAAQGACSIASCQGCHERRHNPKPITVTKKSLKEQVA